MSSSNGHPDPTDLSVAPQRIVIDEDLTAPPTRFRRGLYRVVRRALLGAAKLWFGLEVDGREHLPASGSYILAPVHRSNLDFALVLACAPQALPRYRYLAKDTLWKGAWGRLWTALGAIPVHRGTPDREALGVCARILDAGEPLVIFPEGTRQSGPTVQELFDGVAYLQAKSGVPVIPVAIGGSEAAMPKGSKLIHRTKVKVRIGRALPAPALSDSGRVRRSSVKAQTDRLHDQLQELFDELAAEL